MRQLLQTIYQGTTACQRTPRRVAAAVELADWDELEEARSWCQNRFVERGMRYQPHINVINDTALFDFEDARDAVEFKLAFG